MNNGGKIILEPRKFVAPEYIFGIDTRKMAANYCQKLGAKKVLLVTDNGIINTPWFPELEQDLQELKISYVVFSSVTPNPRDYEVMEGTQFYKEHKCNLILAIGGGSVIDCAKGIGIVSTNQKHIQAYEGIDMIDYPIPPLVCIPTTGGTSADVSQFAIINNTSEKYKMAIISKALVPDVALIDPVVLTSMDSYLSACTGMDALSHAFEAFVSNASSAFTDLYALEAIKLLSNNLLMNIQKPDDIDVRANIMLASLYAGLAFSNASLGCVHSLSHSLGGYLDLPHGECNAIMLSHVVDFNYNHANERYKKIAETIGLNVSGLTENQIKKLLINYLTALRNSLNINSTLRNKGVKPDITPTLAGKAIHDPCNATNPRVPKKEDLEALYKEAI